MNTANILDMIRKGGIFKMSSNDVALDNSRGKLA